MNQQQQPANLSALFYALSPTKNQQIYALAHELGRPVAKGYLHPLLAEVTLVATIYRADRLGELDHQPEAVLAAAMNMMCARAEHCGQSQQESCV
jgi:hypothetical protein